MNRYQFDESMKRITPLFAQPFKDEHKVAWVEWLEAIYASIAWMKPFEFDEVCKAVARECGDRKPKPSTFIAVHHKLTERHGWKRDTVSGKTCGACDGTKIVLAHYRRVADSYEMDAMKPCPVCDPYTKKFSAEVWEEVEFTESWSVREARKLSRPMAQAVLDMAESMKIEFPVDVIVALGEEDTDGEDAPFR
jgi:hypothetical protein